MRRKRGEYRLPTEAEWEYARQGGNTAAWCFGNDSEFSEQAWWKKNSGEKTHPVGQKNPSPFGLHDMYGNVWEWCQDRYARDYYGDSPTSDPSGAQTGSMRVARGACWIDHVGDCRSADRIGYEPTDRRTYLGFRVARNPVARP